MKSKSIELLRWGVALTFGGFGACMLVELFQAGTKNGSSVLMLPMGYWVFFLFVVTPLMLAHFIMRRRYNEFGSALSMLVAIVVWCMLMSLPGRLGWRDSVFHWLEDSPSLALLGLPVSMLLLFGPFFAAAWVYRFGIRLAARYLPAPARKWPGPASPPDSPP